MRSTQIVALPWAILLGALVLFPARAHADDRPWMGFGFDESEAGIVVTRIDPGGPADKAGFANGDILLRLGKSGIADSDDLVSAVQQLRIGKLVAVVVRRGKKRKRLAITPQRRPSRAEQLRERWLGKKISMDDLRHVAGPKARAKAKVVVVEFMATWCGACEEARPFMVGWRKKYPDAEFITVSDEAPLKLVKYQESEKLHLPMMHDREGQLATALGVQVLPVFFVMNEGRVVHVDIGAGKILKRIGKRLRKLVQENRQNKNE